MMLTGPMIPTERERKLFDILSLQIALSIWRLKCADRGYYILGSVQHRAAIDRHKQYTRIR